MKETKKERFSEIERNREKKEWERKRDKQKRK